MSVLLKAPVEAFGAHETLAGAWRELGYTRQPDLERAVAEFQHFESLLRQAGAEVTLMPASAGTGPDSIYVRDASVICAGGAVLARMGKAARAGEPEAQGLTFESLGIPILGRIEPPGTMEGGDVCWLDSRTVVVGRGYRTNEAGIEQLRCLLGPFVDEFIVAALPHFRGPGDVFHLMSILSPVDDDLAVVHSPLMPVPLRERLVDRGTHLVEVPPEEFDTLGCNVLATGPRACVIHEGNPRTRDQLVAAGATVTEYAGYEISLPGQGGPTCLTRPLIRAGQSSGSSSD